MLRSKITVRTPPNLAMDKQTIFALASALTLTAKQGQAASIKAIEGAFTVRTTWLKPSNVFGVRVKPATKQNLVAWVGTAAEWLEKFIKEPAGAIVLKIPQGEFLAIPTPNVRRTKRDLIRATQRPRALRGKRDFLIPLRSGRGFLLAQHQGRGKNQRTVILYVLVKRARIRERDVLYGPTRRAYERNFSKILGLQLQRAFATARR
jgi:hypothetical protein